MPGTVFPARRAPPLNGCWRLSPPIQPPVTSYHHHCGGDSSIDVGRTRGSPTGGVCMNTASRPPNATFDAAALVVWESFSRDAFLAAVSVSTVARRDVPQLARRPTHMHLPRNVRERHMAVLRSREHEWTHYRQHVSTEFGLTHHRLSALQATAAQLFFSARPDHVGPLTFALAEIEGRPMNKLKPGDEWLLAWRAAATVAGSLWTSNPRMIDFAEQWEICTHVMGGFFAQDHKARLLASKRAADAPAYPAGSVSIEALVEGFATYREGMELLYYFPIDEVVGYLAPRNSAEANSVHRYLMEALGLPFLHPLTGALMDLAVALFPDPCLSDGDDVMLWEDISPAFRFHAAVEVLARRGPPFPEDPRDAYAVAMSAFGIEHDSGRRTLRRPEDLSAPNRDHTPNPMGLAIDFYRRMFIAGLCARDARPSLFFSPQVALVQGDREGWDEFLEIGTPPLLAGPDGVTATRRFISDDEKFVVIVAAAASYLVEDLARDGRFSRALAFLGLLAPGVRGDVIQFVELLLQYNLGDAYRPTLQQQLRATR